MAPSPTVWVDADASPRAVKEVLYKASERRGLVVVLVANCWFRHPQGGGVRFVQVDAGPDVADHYIAEHSQGGDLVITADIPLAARVVPKGVAVIAPHGRELDQESIDEALSLRDFKESLREMGTVTGGPPSYGPKQKQRFSNALDRWITMAERMRSASNSD
jgi:uncharacterized protein